MRQVAFILSAILLGVVFPFGRHYAFLVRYFVMLMLFFAFLNIDFHSRILTRLHFKILFFNILIPLALFGLLYPFNHLLAISAFVVAVAPTAAGAPVITDFLKADVAFVTVSVILTSPVIAVLLPFILPPLLGSEAKFSILDLIAPIFSLVFIPLIISQFIKSFFRKLHGALLKLKFLAFYLFIGNVFIACGKAAHFIKNDETAGMTTIGLIAGLSAGICLFQFLFGQYLGRAQFSIEGSMALGRKNTMFSIWLALTFINPIAALAPIFYILYQNLYNARQIYRQERVEVKKDIPVRG